MLTINISAFYLSLKYLPISDVLTLFHLKPFPTAILCMVVLKEIISRVQVAAMGEFLSRSIGADFNAEGSDIHLRRCTCHAADSHIRLDRSSSPGFCDGAHHWVHRHHCCSIRVECGS